MQTGAVPNGGVWYTALEPGEHRLFRGRHYQQLAIDGGRVVVTSRRGRVVLEAAIDDLEVGRVRNGILLQVLVRDATSRTYLFEFRPRRHAAGRAFAGSFR